MVEVRRDLCLGCRLCAMNCPQGAITVIFGKAAIDYERCISCYRCIQVCPMGAITEELPILLKDLTILVNDLQGRMEEVMERIEDRKSVV